MQVKFSRPVMLGGKTYTKGEHDVTVPDAERWFFDALIADGQITLVAQVDEAKPDAVEKPKRRKKE